MKPIGKAGEPGDAPFLWHIKNKKRTTPIVKKKRNIVFKGPGYATGGRVALNKGGQPAYKKGDMPKAKPC